ncbi:hypothetical protein Q4R49_14575 [Morganella morganii subsp. sibonii]
MVLDLFGFIKKIMTEKALACAYGLMSTIVLIGYQSTTNAAPIIVQNGRGLVGVIEENFSIAPMMAVTAMNEESKPNVSYVHLQAYPNSSNCGALQSELMTIDGIKGLKFNAEGTLMLVPEITFIDSRSWDAGKNNDIITGIFNGYGSNTNENLGYDPGCIWNPLQSTPTTGFISHNVSAKGRVLIYGTGQQTLSQASGNLKYPFQITVISPAHGVSDQKIIVPAGGYIVMVSDLGCTLTTPTVIDFGPQPANATNGQLLTTKSDSNLTVNCQQNTNPMSATLSVSAGINPIYFSGDSYQVNLLDGENKPGAYVTMSLNINGTPTNIPFNRTPVDIGSISSSNSDASFSYPITYSLYSRGTGVTGKVKGSAELSIILR